MRTKINSTICGSNIGKKVYRKSGCIQVAAKYRMASMKWMLSHPKSFPPRPEVRRNANGRCLPIASSSNQVSDIFVLDFDGVLCDSQKEVSTAGLETAIERWPDVFGGIDAAGRENVLLLLEQARPRLVRGYETMVMSRMLWENEENVSKILDGDWDSESGLLHQTLKSWGESEVKLNEEFEMYRGKRMQRLKDDWFGLNPLYPGVLDAINDCREPFYICSSKGGDRLCPLLNQLLNLNVSEESPQIFSGLIPPTERKIEVLKHILNRPLASNPSTTLHFIDDRFETILAVSQEPELSERYRLYLADWGYNTATEREMAQNVKGIQVVDLQSFCELLKWGIVMKVDDGCQDTEEEAQRGVYTPYSMDKS